MEQVILDVREKDEFEAEHIDKAVHVPLSHFASQAPGILEQLKEKELLIMCRSGKRAQLARDQIVALGFPELKCQVYEGGMLAWKKRGNPTVEHKKGHLPIMRQVQLIAGLLVLSSAVATLLVDVRFAFLAAFVGAGLTLAGSTGFCPMAELLARLPWNRKHPREERICS